MDYLSQGSPRMYMAQSALEVMASSPAPALYSATAIQSGISSLSYTTHAISNNFWDLIPYGGSGLAYSHSAFPLSCAPAQSIGMNSSYLSNIMASYGANPNAVRANHSSFDLMSALAISGSGNSVIHVEADFNPFDFIAPKAGGIFASNTKHVENEIKTAFEKLMGEKFPSDIKVSILPLADFRKICPQPGVVGVSYNRRKFGLISEIFVLEGSIASVMLTVGHEIGHVLTSTLEDSALEEAKAYAFSFAWMEIIRKYNIAGLENSFVSTLPAANGIHDKGYGIVKRLIVEGREAFSIYRDLVIGGICSSSC